MVTVYIKSKSSIGTSSNEAHAWTGISLLALYQEETKSEVGNLPLKEKKAVDHVTLSKNRGITQQNSVQLIQVPQAQQAN